MEKVESILPSSLWHQLTRIWPRRNWNRQQDPGPESGADLKPRTLHWTGLTHLCAKINEFKPNRTDKDQTKTKESRSGFDFICLHFLLGFQSFTAVLLLYKKRWWIAVIKKSEKTKKYNKGLFVYCCKPASSRRFDSCSVHGLPAGAAVVNVHRYVLWNLVTYSSNCLMCVSLCRRWNERRLLPPATEASLYEHHFCDLVCTAGGREGGEKRVCSWAVWLMAPYTMHLILIYTTTYLHREASGLTVSCEKLTSVRLQ